MNIDVYSDTVCPWCRIGKAHLDEAISQWEGEPVTVAWHPFFLRPDMPVEGKDFRQHMTAIKGDANIEPLLQRVCDAGEACDVTFNWDRVQTAPNTLLSHVLIAAVLAERRDEAMEAVHHAYFEAGRDIGNVKTLVEIAGEMGLERDEIRARLTDPALQAAVADEADQARRLGITGVPFFIFNDALAVSGAQPAAQLLSVMRQASELGTAGA